MTSDQEKHIDSLVEVFSKKAKFKYAAGVKEHGGNIWELPKEKLIEAAEEEIIDMWVYLQTLKEVLNDS